MVLDMPLLIMGMVFLVSNQPQLEPCHLPLSLVAERGGNVDHFDVAAQAGVERLQVIDHDLGELVLLGIVQAVAIDALLVVVFGADH